MWQCNRGIITHLEQREQIRHLHVMISLLLPAIKASENFVLIALDYPILEKMVALKEVPELHDKIIVSTAKYLKLPIITKDKILQKLTSVKTIW